MRSFYELINTGIVICNYNYQKRAVKYGFFYYSCFIVPQSIPEWKNIQHAMYYFSPQGILTISLKESAHPTPPTPQV